MMVSFRTSLICLIATLAGALPAQAEDRISLPKGLRNLHNQTQQQQHGKQQHGKRQAGRRGHAPYYGPYRHHRGGASGLYLGYGSAGYWPPGIGYGVAAPGFRYGLWSAPEFYLNFNTTNWLPPVYAPPQINYGPLANERFFGIHRGVVGQQPAAIQHRRDLQQNLTAQEIATNLRVSNQTTRQRGERFVEFGDQLFRKQRFHEAVQRYKSAIEAAPDLAEAYYHNIYALIAIKQYSLAMKALRIAAELDPQMVADGLELEQLYGDNRLAMTAHLETLAGAATERKEDGELLVLIGLFLRDEGQPARAAKFLQQAADLDPDLGRVVGAVTEHDKRQQEPPVAIQVEQEI